MNLLVGIPVVALVIVAVLFITGAFDQDPIVPPIDIPTVPDDIPTITLPTEEEIEVEVENNTPLCEEFLYVNLHTNGMLIYEGLLNCHLIGVYTEDPNVIVTYPHITVQTIFDSRTSN